MTPRRKETNGENSQPVRFYKYIALTFLIVTIVLLGVIVSLSSKRAVITITASQEQVEVKEILNIGAVESAVAGKVETAVVSLEKTFQPQAGREEPAVATGRVTLHNEEDYNQPLVATTRLLTAEGILFRLKERAAVPAKGTAVAEVYADKAGKESEIGPSRFTIPGLSADKQAVIYATSEKPMAGGWKKIGILGESDWQKGEKELLAEIEKIGKEKLTALQPDFSAVYKLIDPEITSKQKIGEEAGEFTLSGQATVVGVFYNSVEVKNLMAKELNKRVVSEDELLTIDNPEPTVNLESYEASSTIAIVNVSASGLVSLNPESGQFAKSLFFGKNKEEVRRYLLSLDHVQGVEVKFTPAWMRSVPPVPEHVSVVVKMTE